MSYTATVLKVMIASPSDVSEELKAAREVIHEWNAINAEDREIIAMPVAWESHSSPEMGDRPQAIINKQILAKCDLLVAIFWTRLGSPTGAAPSGTVEEIEEHLAARKPALIYFSSVPIPPDRVDSVQYSALRDFKASCQSRGLIVEYGSSPEFRDKFMSHFAKTIIRSFSHGTSREAGKATPRPQEQALSAEAKELLVEASRDPQGAIEVVLAGGGTEVVTNGRNFVEKGNPRSEATWRDAVEKLQRSSLIEDRDGEGKVFFVTKRGYSTVELLGGE